MIRISMLKPTDYQRELKDLVLNDVGGRVITVKSCRQMGKSLFIQQLLTYKALKSKCTNIYISPTWRQSLECYKGIVKVMKKTGFVKSANSSLCTIEFLNGSEIICLSGEAGDGLRGYTCKGKDAVLVMDEANFLKGDVYDICFPFTNAFNNDIILISTPLLRTGNFYNYYMKGVQNESGFYSLDWAEYTNPFISKDRLEMYRKSLAPQVFQAEYLGQFIDAKSALFGDLERHIDNNPDLGLDNKMGVDWGGQGSGGDNTCISVMNSNHQQVYIEAFNDLNVEDTINRIVEVAIEYNVSRVTYESNSIGAVYGNLLKKKLAAANIVSVPFNTTNDTKRSIIEYMQVCFQNDDITILDDKEFLYELLGYEMQMTPSGKITYNNNPNMVKHDDRVIATAIALYSFKKQNKISYI